jgi:two-component system, response regulator PdtaR
VPALNVAAVDRLQWVSESAYRVVIAEDEALIRLDLKEMLEEPGEGSYVVIGEASDGDTAVQLAADLKPDLVIMDIKMPVLDGISAAEQITERRLAPVVILTAFSQRDLVQRASSAGAMAYLVKPFTKAELIPAIEIAVSRFAELAALQSEISDLRDRLAMRKLLDRAKGVLQVTRGMTEPEAFRWIQKTSMDRRTTMRALAQEILDNNQPAPRSGAIGPGDQGTGGGVGGSPGSDSPGSDSPGKGPGGPGTERRERDGKAS